MVALTLVFAFSRADGLDVDTRLGRWTTRGFVEGYAVFESDHDTARQRPAALIDLQLLGEVTRHARCFLDVRNLWGGTSRGADGAGVINLHDVFQNVSPSFEVEEGYVDLFLPQLDVRLGKQTFAWGRLDAFHPTDVLNPKRFTDPFITDDEDAKIGIPAARATYYLPDLGTELLTNATASAVWVPITTPFRFPLQQERWFPASAQVPPQISIPAGFFGLGIGADIHTSLHTANASPPQQLGDGGAAVRLTGLSDGADWALTFYDGPETAPAFTLMTSVTAPLSDILALRGDAVLTPRFGRIDLVGGDVAFHIGDVTVRAEAAYATNRLLPRSTDDLLSLNNIGRTVGALRAPGCQGVFCVIEPLLKGETVPINLGDLFVQRDTVEWGVGADYPIRGWVPVLQLNQMLILHNHETLLINDVDTRIVLALRRSFFDERLKMELIGFQGLERSYTTGIARWTYAITDSLRLRVGYLFLAGSRHTIVGQYQDNDEAFVQLRYTL